MMQKISVLCLFGLAFSCQAANGEQKQKLEEVLWGYTPTNFSNEKLEKLCKLCTKEELSAPGSQRITPLMQVLGIPDAVKILLEHGADPTLLIHGQDMLTRVFKNAYVFPALQRWEFGKVLDILKEHMDIASEKAALDHALKHGMKFTKEQRGIVFAHHLCLRFAVLQAGRDYAMVCRHLSEPKEEPTKPAKRK